MQSECDLLPQSKFIPVGRNYLTLESASYSQAKPGRLGAKGKITRARGKIVSDMNLVGPNSRTVLLSGASGMLGSAIGKALRQRGTKLIRLVRRAEQGPDEVRWNPADESTRGNAIEIARLEGIDAAVHLSGANVASRRWTDKYKREMTESRVTATRMLAEVLARLKNPPEVLVAASAVGFYGNRGDEALDEDSAAGQGYFPELCTAWEEAARPAVEAGIRVVHPRFGMVLGRDGGALARLAPLFRLGLGGKLGNGRQWMSWVSEADAVAAVLFALENPALSGAANVVAPEPVTNAEFTRALGRAVHRPAGVAAPAFALRLAFGEMANEALLASTRAVPKRLLEAGFVFRYPTLVEAFKAALA
jgi:uncharacterized protein